MSAACIQIPCRQTGKFLTPSVSVKTASHWRGWRCWACTSTLIFHCARKKWKTDWLLDTIRTQTEMLMYSASLLNVMPAGASPIWWFINPWPQPLSRSEDHPKQPPWRITAITTHFCLPWFSIIHKNVSPPVVFDGVNTFIGCTYIWRMTFRFLPRSGLP